MKTHILTIVVCFTAILAFGESRVPYAPILNAAIMNKAAKSNDGTCFRAYLNPNAPDLDISTVEFRLEKDGKIIKHLTPRARAITKDSPMRSHPWIISLPLGEQYGGDTELVHNQTKGGFDFRLCFNVGEKNFLAMVLIPVGTNSGEDPDSGHYSLTVNAFYMDSAHITKEQWDMVFNWATTNGYRFDNIGLSKAPNHPVHSINWYDMLKWCNARSQMNGREPCYSINGSPYKSGQVVPDCDFDKNGYRLPTNDEWEYAARGGLKGKRFPWGDTITHHNANYKSTTNDLYDVSSTRGCHPRFDEGMYPHTSPVYSFPPNRYGVFDTAGNIYDRTWAPESGMNFRGGTWTSTAYGSRTWFGGRTKDLTSIDNRYGFRCVSNSKN